MTKCYKAIDHAINCVGAIEQIKWERDIAIQQLNELGYQFGEKPHEWIDVKDRLPKESENVLITCFYCYSGEYEVTLGNCNSNGEWYYADERVLISNADSTEENSAQIVIAWKPLPEPYVRSEE